MWGEVVCCVWDVVDTEDTEEVLCVCVCRVRWCAVLWRVRCVVCALCRLMSVVLLLHGV